MERLHHPDTSAATRRIDEFRSLTPWVMITKVENHTAQKVSSEDCRVPNTLGCEYDSRLVIGSPQA
jgi:hypothetical protein